MNGDLRGAFGKLAKVQQKQNFSFAVVVGDLFRDASTDDEREEVDALLGGSIAVPLPTYFSVGEVSLPQPVAERLDVADEVCPNLFYLGRKGTVKTSEGIRIVALGGRLVEHDTSGPKSGYRIVGGSQPQNEARSTASTLLPDLESNNISKYDPYYTVADARGLQGAHTAHILITNQFPFNILQGSRQQIPDAVRIKGSHQCLSDLCATLKPRYHFSSCPEAYFEREPFFHPAEYESMDFEPITRFMSFASYANSSKDNKWLSAFKIDPSGPPSDALDKTSTPFSRSLSPGSRKRHALPDQADSYSHHNGGSVSHRAHRRRQPAGARIEGCFFCLTDPEAKTHLVAAIGDPAYITVPKGPLPLSSSFPSLGFPGHMLVVPDHHTEDSLSMPLRPEAEAETEYQEMQRFRKAMYKMLQERGASSLGAVCWEANRSRVRHQHWQFCPVATDQVTSGLVEAAFKLDRENNEYALFQPCDPDSRLDQRAEYFRVWIWSPPPRPSNPVEAANQVNGEDAEGREKSMFFPLPSNQKFDIQFGRKVMAKILKLDHRSDWRNAQQTEEEEERDKEAFQRAFKAFDFTGTIVD